MQITQLRTTLWVPWHPQLALVGGRFRQPQPGRMSRFPEQDKPVKLTQRLTHGDLQYRTPIIGWSRYCKRNLEDLDGHHGENTSQRLQAGAQPSEETPTTIVQRMGFLKPIVGAAQSIGASDFFGFTVLFLSESSPLNFEDHAL